MKLLKKLVKRSIAGDVILVPVGDSSLQLKGLITLNETGELLWDALPAASGPEALAETLQREYEVDAATARADTEEFLSRLRALGII